MNVNMNQLSICVFCIAILALEKTDKFMLGKWSFMVCKPIGIVLIKVITFSAFLIIVFKLRSPVMLA